MSLEHPPDIFYWVKVRILARPVQNLNPIRIEEAGNLERRDSSWIQIKYQDSFYLFGSVTWGVVLLEAVITPETKHSCRFLQISFKNFDVQISIDIAIYNFNGSRTKPATVLMNEGNSHNCFKLLE